MITYIKKATTVITTIALALCLLSPVAVSAQSVDDVCEGVGAAAGGSGCAASGGGSIENVVRAAIDIFSVIIGIIGVVMIMVSGFKYITSSGDASNISSAKQTLVYAIVGLIIAVLAQVIARFVLTRTTNPNP